jgi:hypothetical protein
MFCNNVNRNTNNFSQNGIFVKTYQYHGLKHVATKISSLREFKIEKIKHPNGLAKPERGDLLVT